MKPWKYALQSFATLLDNADKASVDEVSASEVMIGGGNGWQAVYLSRILRQQATPISLRVSDRVSEAIANTLVLSNLKSSEHAIEIKRVPPTEKGKISVDRICEVALNSWQKGLGLDWGANESSQSEREHDQSSNQNNTGLFIFPDVCTPQLRLRQLATEILNVSPAGAILCPSMIKVWACIVKSQDLITMNEVVTPYMMEDTGLKYGLANEHLWRPHRPVQVDRHLHTLLSHPFELLSISVKDLISPDKRRRILKQRKSIEVPIVHDGSLDCLIYWIDYRLYDGGSEVEAVTLSYAPYSITAGLREGHPCLTTHSWQRAHYFPLKTELRAGQSIKIDLLLDHDDLRLEIDEDSFHEKVSRSLDLCPGMPLDDDEGEDESDLNGKGVGNEPQIPAYHMSMLNDRERTIKYRVGIQEAVSKLKSPSDLILDIGTGTGLLSMIAAKAGATNILSFEREPTLALAASSLINANGLSDAIEVVNRNCQEISLGEGKAALVIHEIFGTDPLSEQILPTMRFVQEAMTLPSTNFVPARFKSIAALAWSGGRVRQAHCKAPPSDERLDLSCIEDFAPWKIEANLVDVSGLVLLSQPSDVLHFDLQSRPLPMEGSETIKVSLCAPTSSEEFIARGKNCLPLESGNGGEWTADCIVSWFEADMGDGGWLSTAPGHTTRHGHWVQTIQFIEPVKLSKKGSKKAEVSILGSYQKDRCVFSVSY